MKYVDSELKKYEEIVEKSLNDAIANFAIDGITINEEEKQKVRKYFLENKKRLVLQRKGSKNHE